MTVGCSQSHPSRRTTKKKKNAHAKDDKGLVHRFDWWNHEADPHRIPSKDADCDVCDQKVCETKFVMASAWGPRNTLVSLLTSVCVAPLPARKSSRPK
jgi:hypothetical protein